MISRRAGPTFGLALSTFALCILCGQLCQANSARGARRARRPLRGIALSSAVGGVALAGALATALHTTGLELPRAHVEQRLSHELGRVVQVSGARLHGWGDELRLRGVNAPGRAGAPGFQAERATLWLNPLSFLPRAVRPKDAPSWKAAEAFGAGWSNGHPQPFAFEHMVRRPGEAEDHGTFVGPRIGQTSFRPQVNFTFRRHDGRFEVRVGGTRCDGALNGGEQRSGRLEASCAVGGDGSLRSVLADLQLGTLLSQLPKPLAEALARFEVHDVTMGAGIDPNRPIYTQRPERFDFTLEGRDHADLPVSIAIRGADGRAPRVTVERGRSRLSWSGLVSDGRLVADIDTGELGLAPGTMRISGKVSGSGGRVTLRDAEVAWPPARLSVAGLTLGGLDRAAASLIGGGEPAQQLTARATGAVGRLGRATLDLHEVELKPDRTLVAEGHLDAGRGRWPTSVTLDPQGAISGQVVLSPGLSAICAVGPGAPEERQDWGWKARCQTAAAASVGTMLAAAQVSAPEGRVAEWLNGLVGNGVVSARGSAGQIESVELAFVGKDPKAKAPVELRADLGRDRLSIPLPLGDLYLQSAAASHRGEEVLRVEGLETTVRIPSALLPLGAATAVEVAGKLQLTGSPGEGPAATGARAARRGEGTRPVWGDVRIRGPVRARATELRLGAGESWPALGSGLKAGIPSVTLSGLTFGPDSPLPLPLQIDRVTYDPAGGVAHVRGGVAEVEGAHGGFPMHAKLWLSQAPTSSQSPSLAAEGTVGQVPFRARMHAQGQRVRAQATAKISPGMTLALDFPDLKGDPRRLSFATEAGARALRDIGLPPGRPEAPLKLSGSLEHGVLRVEAAARALRLPALWDSSTNKGSTTKGKGRKRGLQLPLEPMLSTLRIDGQAHLPVYLGSIYVGEADVRYDSSKRHKLIARLSGPIEGSLALDPANLGAVLFGSLRGRVVWPIEQTPIPLEGPLAKLAGAHPQK
jgi:hypothetical protein